MLRMSINPEQDVQDQLQATMAAAPPVAAYMQPVDPHASLTAPIGPTPPTPPTMAPPKQSSTGMSQKPIEDNLTMRLQKDYQKDADPYGSPDNHPGFLGKLLHGLNVATGGVNRRGFEEQGLENRIQGLAKNESEEGLQGAQTKKVLTDEQGDELENANKPQEQADTHDVAQSQVTEHNAQAASLLHPQAKTDFEAWQKQNPSKPIEEWLNAVAKAKATNEKPDPAKQQYIDEYQRSHPGGTIAQALHSYAVDTQPPQRPPIINVGNQDFQMQERGRQLLDKAETQYRTAQQGANGLRDMIAQADAGNKVSAQVLPLQGALEITTAQGVHRINRTEVDQYAGAGNLYDRVAGELGKLTSGQPIPPNIRQDMRKLADIEEQAAYKNYLGAHDSAVKRYKLDGEEPVAAPIGLQQGGKSESTVSPSEQPIVQQSPSTGQFRYSTDGGKTWQAGKPKGQ